MNTFEGESNICMTYAAARNFDNDFIRAGFETADFAPLEKSTGSLQLEAVRSLDPCQLRPPGVRLNLIVNTHSGK